MQEVLVSNKHHSTPRCLAPLRLGHAALSSDSEHPTVPPLRAIPPPDASDSPGLAGTSLSSAARLWTHQLSDYRATAYSDRPTSFLILSHTTIGSRWTRCTTSEEWKATRRRSHLSSVCVCGVCFGRREFSSPLRSCGSTCTCVSLAKYSLG